MGVAVGPGRLAVGTRRQIHFLRAAHDLASNIEPPSEGEQYDACWLARNAFVTGNIHGHELAWGEEGLWIVNTLFSCLCTLHVEYNFVPRWRPPFISELIDQDRCHLNGLAMESGRPRFVTVLAESDEPAGWRPTRATSGCLIDVPSGETIVRGLSMPHSPRLYGGHLWVLDSGRGLLSHVNPQDGQVDEVAALPGYTRGLAFCGRYAFVGLSKIRETAVFGGLPIAEQHDELRCGVGVIELSTGRTVAALQFHSGVDEVFAVEALPGVRNPKLCGPAQGEEHDREIWVVPQGSDSADLPATGARLAATSESDSSAVDPVRLGTGWLAGFPPAAGRQDEPVELGEAAAGLVSEGLTAHQEGRLADALQCLRGAAELEPESATLMDHLGNLHQDMGDRAAAVDCYQRAAALQPGFPAVHQNLGVLLSSWGEPNEALHEFELAQQSQPEAMNLVLGATVLPVIYDSVDDVHAWRSRLAECVRTLADAGVTVDTSDTLIPTHFSLVYQGENDRDVMQGLGRVYRGVECCPPAHAGGWRPPGPRIRVGFLSAHFRDHTIGRLNLGCIQRLSRDDFEVSVISLGAYDDPMARAFRHAADVFVEVPRHPATARRMIAELELDVLVFADVGMDAVTQTLAYSRMAPIQCVTWGHPDTTGSPAIDYFISSALTEPDDADDHYSERLMRLPSLGVCYSRPKLSGSEPTREYFGLAPDRHVYLCPQTLFKFHPEFDPVLRGILESDPQSDLVVLEGRVPNWTARLQRRWARTLPDTDRRVRFLPPQPNADYLKLLACADAMLDPFPFGGGNTTYEALAVGTPVVTLPGRFLRGRISHGLYQRMGMSSTVAASSDEYVELAVRLATDDEFSRTLRQEIAETCDVLFDNDEDVTVWEDILREVIEENGKETQLGTPCRAVWDKVPA